MNNPGKRRLGRGLAALIGDDLPDEMPVSQPISAESQARGLRSIPVAFIQASPNNPRKFFREDDLQDLARSLREKGLLQPLVVRPIQGGKDQFELVAGERRWRAAQRAGLHEVPVLIRDLSDGEALEIALIENIQRSDLNPLEEARAYAQLMQEFDYTQQQLAESLGKSRSHIANTLRLLNLPDLVRQQIEEGKLTAGHARALVATDAPEDLAQQIIALGLSVREAEQLTRGETLSREKGTPEKDANLAQLERQLSEMLGLKVAITDKGSKGGALVISYKNMDQLDQVCRKLGAD
jgi:ParB family transcriptional regulator, chromosome partitioning protein